MCAGRRRSRPMKILVIDDHVLIREALQGVLKKLRRDATILEASNGGQARRLIEEHSDLELILLDLNLPDADGFHLLADLRAGYPAVSIVVLSAANERDNVVRALDLGALGFIPKSAPRAVMLRPCNWCSPEASTFHPKFSATGSCSHRKRRSDPPAIGWTSNPHI